MFHNNLEKYYYSSLAESMLVNLVEKMVTGPEIGTKISVSTLSEKEA